MFAARIAGNVVVEIVELPDHVSHLVDIAEHAPSGEPRYETRESVLGDFFHADVGFEIVASGVGVGMVRGQSGAFEPGPSEIPNSRKMQFSFLEFMDLFTPDEQGAIVSSDNAQVKLFLLSAAGNGHIIPDDDRTISAIDILVTLKLLTKARGDAIKIGSLPT